MAELGIDLMARADMAIVRRKSMALTDLFIRLVEQKCRNSGFKLASPRDANERGSQVSFHHPHGYAIMRALIDQGVIGDFRAPDIIRVGFAPLYVRYIDVWEAAETLAEIMSKELWRKAEYQIRDAVT